MDARRDDLGMRIGLMILEALLYLVALFGFVLGIVIVGVARGANPDPAMRAAGVVAGLYVALPAFTLGAVGLAGGAILMALERTRRDR